MDISLINNKSKMSNIIALLISLLLIYIFINKLFELPYNNKVTASASLIILLLTLITVFPKISLSQVILFIFIIILSMIVAPNNRLWYLFYRLYWSITAFSLGVIVVHTTPNRFILSVPFYVLTIVILGVVFIYGDTMTKATGNQKLALFNRNSVAMFAYTYAAIPMLYTAIKKTPIHFSEIFNLALLVFVQSLTSSRAGILISILYSLIVIIYLLKNLPNDFKDFTKGSTRIHLSLSFLSIITIVIFIIIVILNSRLAEVGVSSNGRMAIYNSYFSELNFSRFILGFHPSAYLETHMHNSFLELLVTSGFIGALPVFILITISFIRLFKRSLLLVGIYILVILYSMVEYYFFFLQGDFLLIPIIIYALHPNPKERKL